MAENIKIDTKNIFYPPGGILMWIIIYLELITFGLALVFMAINAKESPDLFHESRQMLTVAYGAVNTLFLLSSGWCMAQSIHFFKATNYHKSRMFLNLTILGGILFLLIKSLEYYEKIDVGLTMGFNLFFTYYWMLTLFHVVHVIVGLIILMSMRRSLIIKPKELKPDDFEAAATFWHMCDLIWLLLFPIIYLFF